MGFIDTLRRLTPKFLLGAYRNFKKRRTRKSLEKAQRHGNVFSSEDIINDLIKLHIHQGDTIMVHASMSKIGALHKGPETIIDALIKVIGPKGNLMMPSSPNGVLQFDYIQKMEYFDVRSTPSAMGAISEFFRKMPGVRRSASPTEPVCVLGPDSDWFVRDHLGMLTPYGPNSPWSKLADKKGKILYIGVTLDNAGTSLHVLEDAVESFKFPVYHEKVFEVKVIDENGSEHKVKTLVHNPLFSARRKCDQLIPMFEKRGVVIFGKIGNASTMCFDAEKMKEVMLDEYQNRGITMYTPHGEELNY